MKLCREDKAIRIQLTFVVCESEPLYEQLKQRLFIISLSSSGMQQLLHICNTYNNNNNNLLLHQLQPEADVIQYM